MEYEFNESLRDLVPTDKNHADIFNLAPQKLLENTKYNKEHIEALRNMLNEVLAQFDDYLTTEQLSLLLETGIKGDKGDTGKNLEFSWDGTNLGIRQQGEANYQFVDLKGEPGEVTLDQLNSVKDEFESEISNIPKVTKTSELNNDSGYITSSDIPTSLPASDVYEWAKASTKPSYTASEVGAASSSHTHSYAGSSSSGGAATSANKVNSNLTLQLAGTTKNTFNGSSAQTFNVPAASTSEQGIVKLNNTLTSTSTTEAATAAQAKALNDAITSLKTTSVNGKKTVADAINGKCGTSLTSATSYEDMAYYINNIQTVSKSATASTSASVGNSYWVIIVGSDSRTTGTITWDKSVSYFIANATGSGADSFKKINGSSASISFTTYNCAVLFFTEPVKLVSNSCKYIGGVLA